MSFYDVSECVIFACVNVFIAMMIFICGYALSPRDYTIVP